MKKLPKKYIADLILLLGAMIWGVGFYFQKKAAEVQKRPAFAKVAEQYNRSPGFRAKIDRSLAGGDAGKALEQEMQRQNQPTRSAEGPELVLRKPQ